MTEQNPLTPERVAEPLSDPRIKPCPFCRSTEVVSWLSHDGIWCVFCKECNAEGPHSHSESDSIELWNSAIVAEEVLQRHGARERLEGRIEQIRDSLDIAVSQMNIRAGSTSRVEVSQITSVLQQRLGWLNEKLAALERGEEAG